MPVNARPSSPHAGGGSHRWPVQRFIGLRWSPAVWHVVTVLAVLVACGCSGRQARPRNHTDIAYDRLRVDTLFIAKDGRKVVQPMNKDGVVVIDAAAGALGWPAWQCNNPDCPGRQADGTPYVFPWPNPFIGVNPDGTLVTRQPNMPAERKVFDEFATQNCPACKERRSLASESPQQRQQYKDWCQPHELPSAAKQRMELDKELQRISAGAKPPSK
jgi:hypothetical protein